MTSAFELVKEAKERLNLRPVSNGVKTCVAADRLEGAGIRVAISAHVQLLNPSLLVIQTTKEEHQIASPPRALFRRNLSTVADLSKNRFSFIIRAEVGRTSIQSMIGQ